MPFLLVLDMLSWYYNYVCSHTILANQYSTILFAHDYVCILSLFFYGPLAPEIKYILSYLILSYLILSYLILSYLILSYLILSYLILSYSMESKIDNQNKNTKWQTSPACEVQLAATRYVIRITCLALSTKQPFPRNKSWFAKKRSIRVLTGRWVNTG